MAAATVITMNSGSFYIIMDIIGIECSDIKICAVMKEELPGRYYGHDRRLKCMSQNKLKSHGVKTMGTVVLIILVIGIVLSADFVVTYMLQNNIIIVG